MASTARARVAAATCSGVATCGMTRETLWSTSMADVHALEETPPDGFEEIAAYTYRTSRVTTP